MVDFLSKTSLLIEQYFNETKLGVATGFVIEKEGNLYLAMNWHVATGKNPNTGENLSVTGGLPNALVIWHYVKSTSPNSLEWTSVRVQLYKNDGEDIHKKWIEHPKGQRVDVVLLPLEDTGHVQINTFNLDLAFTDMLPAPAMPVSIIGFPFGRTAGGVLPIWVTGFIASEPYVDIDEMPLFYVNASGRSGLSGSPVVLRPSGGYHTTEGHFILSGGYQTKFMGIYSGRICNDSDICRVWKPIVFDQILGNIKQ